MSIWDELTPQHKKYAILSVSIGAIFGLLSSVVAFIIISLVAGAGLSVTGGYAIIAKSKLEKDDARNRVYLTIAITSIACAVACFVFTLIGLVAHQRGLI